MLIVTLVVTLIVTLIVVVIPVVMLVLVMIRVGNNSSHSNHSNDQRLVEYGWKPQ